MGLNNCAVRFHHDEAPSRLQKARLAFTDLRNTWYQRNALLLIKGPVMRLGNMTVADRCEKTVGILTPLVMEKHGGGFSPLVRD